MTAKASSASGVWRAWRRFNDARLAVLGPLTLGGAICRGPEGAPRVALTFDDGPDPEITPAILDALEVVGARATFFFTAPALERHAELARRAASRHQIGTHLFSHDRARTESVAAFEEEVRLSFAVHERVLGKRPSALRFPFGHAGQVRRSDAERLGLTPYHWTFSSEDSSAPSAEAIVHHVEPRLHDGAIVLLHDGRAPNSARGTGPRRHTLEALPAVLHAARRRGLSLVTLDELFAPSDRLKVEPAGY